MTESEWNTCADPQPMLEFLRGKASDRKLRLFACACCRRNTHLLRDKRARKAPKVARRFADGIVADQDRSDARKLAQQVAQSRAVTRTPESPKWERRAASAVYYAAARDAMEAAYNAPQLVIDSLIWRAGGHNRCDWEFIQASERLDQVSLLQDIIGNPFDLVSPDASLLTSTVRSLAQAIYNDKAFDRLPVLADALEEAGCTNAELLAHCRGPGPHVRGCWVVDLLLGKE